MARVALLTFVALTTIALAGGIGAAAREGVFRDVPPGTRIDGRVVDTDDPGNWLEQARKRLAAREVTVAVPDGFERVAIGDLGVELDVATMLERLREGSRGSVAERFRKVRDARAGLVDLAPVFRVDEEKAKARLAAFAPEVHRDPVNARLDLMAHARIDDRPGAELDVDASLEALRALPHEEGDVLELRARPIAAAVTSAALANVDVTKVLSSHETTFALSGTGAGRAVNIANAAKKLDGLVLAPGETFSFNEVVGPRTLDRGFTYAPEIVDDELEMGVGGGTCQVASTVHAAAVFGAMDIVERRSHSRPSSYIAIGLDATVLYGQVDLKIRNPYPFPVLIHAYLPKPTAVRVEFLGSDPIAKVEYRFGVQRSEDFYRRITLKPFYPEGKISLHQKGVRGREVVSTVTVTWPDGRVVTRSYGSSYRPVPEVFWVGPGFDEAALPELPEGATRVERRGLPSGPTEASSGSGETKGEAQNG